MIVKSGRQDESDQADVAAAIEAVRADIGRIAADCERLARKRRGAAEAVIAGAVDEVRRQATQVASDLDLFSSYFEAELRDRIRARPLSAVAIAACAGYVVRRARGSRRRR